MRVSRWAGFSACLAAAACGGALAPTGGEGDGGGGGASSSSSGGSSSGVVGGSSGSVGGGSSSTEPSSSGSSGGGASSSGSGSGGAIIDASFGCPNGAPPPMTGMTVCNDCVENFCADSWCACAGDSPVDDSGSVNGCLGFVNCIIACINGAPDAGVPPQTIQQCAMLCAPSYSMQQQQEGDALISCLASSCASPATCGQ